MTQALLMQNFAMPLLAWYDAHGRKDLPWQLPRTPYRVWVSEIMLQQTQVTTVIPYFNRFIEKFPNIGSLALACEDQVLSMWSGLGYYSRARNLHRSAKILLEEYQGNFPTDVNLLVQLPGIGDSTAAAILSQAYNLPNAILDANVKRVLCRYFVISGWPEQAQTKKTLWKLAQDCMPKQRCADYTQAIMDLGATCCKSTKPNCLSCPLSLHCQAFKQQQQTLFPNKKIKKPVPTHQQKMLVLLNNQGQVYLEKRPPTGIWGGLWCLPSVAMDDCPLSFIDLRYALHGEKPEPLIDFKHRFSHFHLEINALSIKTKSAKHTIAESTGQWFSADKLSSLGLAKPTSLILSTYYAGIP